MVKRLPGKKPSTGPDVLELGELAAQDIVRRARAVNASVAAYEEAIKKVMRTLSSSEAFLALG